MIDVQALTKSIDTGTHRVEILKGIDMFVPKGQFAAIMGSSGSGKSTLLGLLAGLDTPTSGRIILDGAEITGLAEDKLAILRGRKIGFVFQSYQLIPTLTAEENVLLPYELVGSNGTDGRARARELLDSVGLADRMDHYPVQLSGGEQQRVALARAFMVKPAILMADEPTGNLDPDLSAEIMQIFNEANVRGSTLIVATHDRELIRRSGRRVLHLENGRLSEEKLQTLEPMRSEGIFAIS
jgi:putative ABC transport system ATP-binding protein